MTIETKHATPFSQIIVTGMHRSGTSAVTRLLSGFGVYIGQPDELTDPGEENPLGFYERRDCRRICDSVLHGVGADWWKVAAFDVDAIPAEMADQHSAALSGLVQELNRHGTWAIKEPRLCLMLPLLLRQLAFPVVVIVVRNPMEVAQSLRARNGIPRVAGLFLWEKYTIAALQYSAGVPRVFVNYDDLTNDPAGNTERLRSDLARIGVAGLGQVDSALLPVPELHRQKSSEPPDAYLNAPQLALWRSLQAESFTTQDPISESPSAHMVLSDFEHDLSEAMAKERAWREAERAWREARLKFESDIRRLQREAETMARRHDRDMNALHSRLTRAIAQLERMLHASAHAIAALDSEIDRMAAKDVGSYIRLGRPKKERRTLKEIRQTLRVGRDFTQLTGHPLT